jgi:hypothetical protein
MYTRRALVETIISQIKRLVGTRCVRGQAKVVMKKVAINVLALNRMLGFDTRSPLP